MKKEEFLTVHRCYYTSISQFDRDLKKMASTHEFKTAHGKIVAKEFVESYRIRIEDYVIHFGKLFEHDCKETRHYFIESDGKILLSDLELAIKTLGNL